VIERIILVTGGAGFIGSHLTEELLNQGHKVTILDNFSNGKMNNIQHSLGNPSLTIAKEDLKRPKKLRQIINASDTIFHLAANPEVKLGETDPKKHFEENILATFNLLETMRKSGKPKNPRLHFNIHRVRRSHTGSNKGRLRAAHTHLNLRRLKTRL